MKTLMYLLQTVAFTALMFLMTFSSAHAGQEVTRFQFPDVRDDFCGININYQYCKCAFHNDFCEDVGLSRGSASTYVWDEYRTWVRGLINTMAVQCVSSGGYWTVSNRSCTVCTDPDVNTGNKCEKPEEADKEDDEAKNECSVDENFDDDWQKYSDIDDRIDEGERSYEAQQYAAVVEQIVTKKAEIYNYKVAMEFDRQARLELRNIRAALVQNIKVNLLKSFWRLSWITYSTIKSGTGTGKDYAEFLEKGVSVAGLAKGIKVIQSNVPGDAPIAIDTSTAAGKVKSVGANAALEALDTIGDPVQAVKVVTKVFNDSAMSTLPSADITPEEIEILRTQHIRERDIDMQIQESYLINSQRRTNVLELEAEITVLEAQAAQWKEKEKARVKDMLEQSCQDNEK